MFQSINGEKYIKPSAMKYEIDKGNGLNWDTNSDPHSYRDSHLRLFIFSHFYRSDISFLKTTKIILNLFPYFID